MSHSCQSGDRWSTIAYGHRPALAGFAHSARIALAALLDGLPIGCTRRASARARHWAALPRTCRRSRASAARHRHRPTAGPFAPSISSAHRPIRRCRLAIAPVWVEAGDAMPDACDCVIDSDLLDQTGPMVQVLAEAIPGQGVRRAGGEIAEGRSVAVSGRPHPRARPADRARGGARDLERAPSAPAHRRYPRNLRALR